MSAALLDTHAWIWWVDDPDRLGVDAARVIASAIASDGLVISAISAWEVALLVKRGRLELDRDVTSWIAGTERVPYVRFAPIEQRVAVGSVLLDGLHDDPADRIIVATALDLGVPLITADRRLRDYQAVTSVW